MKNFISLIGAIDIPKFMGNGEKFYIEYQGTIRAAKFQQVKIVCRADLPNRSEIGWSTRYYTVLRIADCRNTIEFEQSPISVCSHFNLYETLEDFHKGNRASWRVYSRYFVKDLFKRCFNGKAEIYGDREYRKWFRHWKFDGVKAVPCPIDAEYEFSVIIHANGEISTDLDISLKNGCYFTKEECEAANTPKIIDFEDETEEDNPKKKDVFVFGANISVSDSEIDEIKSFLDKFKK